MFKENFWSDVEYLVLILKNDAQNNGPLFLLHVCFPKSWSTHISLLASSLSVCICKIQCSNIIEGLKLCFYQVPLCPYVYMYVDVCVCVTNLRYLMRTLPSCHRTESLNIFCCQLFTACNGRPLDFETAVK